MTLYEKLAKIQQEMKAPKNKYNDFGKYKYRNAESILESFKPFEEKYKVMLTLTDELVQVGERYYIKATACLYDLEENNPCAHSATAYAREAEAQKGKDDSQITGTASSYARKYALNGLFLLDDTKDADTGEFHKESEGRSKERREHPQPSREGEEGLVRSPVREDAGRFITEPMKATLRKELERVGKTEAELLDFFRVEAIGDISVAQYKSVMDDMASAPTVNVNIQEELPFR